MRRRRELLDHPDIVAALEVLWKSANTDADDFIDHDEYLVMHRKITLILSPMTTPRQAVRDAENDWLTDSQGQVPYSVLPRVRFEGGLLAERLSRPTQAGLDQPRFFWTWFELADMYTTTMDPEE